MSSRESDAVVKIFTAYSDGSLALGQHKVRCALGKGGVITECNKREGDGATPLGTWPIRYVYYRPDRVPKPDTLVPVVALSPDDGWCDDPSSPDYNRHVRLPFAPSHEKLWRDDHVYDLIVVLGHNDDPPVAGMGSAIFLHLARENYEGTEGCVAVRYDDLLELLREAEPDSAIQVV